MLPHFQVLLKDARYPFAMTMALNHICHKIDQEKEKYSSLSKGER